MLNLITIDISHYSKFCTMYLKTQIVYITSSNTFTNERYILPNIMYPIKIFPIKICLGTTKHGKMKYSPFIFPFLIKLINETKNKINKSIIGGP